MKRLSSFLVILISFALNAKAQEQITTLNNQTYTGFIFEENSSSISINDLNNVDITINKQDISIRKKVFVNIYNKAGTKYTATLIKSSNQFLEFADSNGKKIRIVKSEID